MSSHYGKLTPSQGKNIRTAAGTRTSGIGAELSDESSLISIILKNDNITITIKERGANDDNYQYSNIVVKRKLTVRELSSILRQMNQWGL